jgi:hypothetical protein
MDALLLGAMRAAEKRPARFHAVADNSAAAMRAFWSQGVNRAFETIEIMRDAVVHDFNGLVVLVPANFTSGPAVAVQISLQALSRFAVFAKGRCRCSFNHAKSYDSAAPHKSGRNLKMATCARNSNVPLTLLEGNVPCHERISLGLVRPYFWHSNRVEKKQRHATQITRIQEMIRANEQRLARVRAAIGSVDAHLQQIERPGPKQEK